MKRGLLVGLFLALCTPVQAAAPDCVTWPRWEKFKHDMLSAGGRVIDASTPRQQTTSEGQSYALLFALIANDAEAFERVLLWTENNLAGGDLSARLPAWQWGRRVDGSWGVLDGNAASDADVWTAYALAEAARLWHVRRYRILSTVIANRILAEETAELPGLGRVLLPAPHGFVPAPGQWRLNPSYLPIQALRRLGAADARWQPLVTSSQQIILRSAPHGYAPEWTLYDGHDFLPDRETQGTGSYNAIRVYLWAGMLPADDPAHAPLLKALAPMAALVASRHAPPETVDTATGAVRRDGPAGFSGALVPFLAAQQQMAETALQLRRAQEPVQDAAPRYYDSVLNLYGLGYQEGLYRFGPAGALLPRWKNPCVSPAPR